MNRVKQHGAMNRVKQHGATLVTALVMLVVLTLLVLSAIRSSTTNLRIAGNMQMQGEIVEAAQQAAEQVISYDFPAHPAWAASAASAATIGNATYTTVASAVCTGNKPVPNSTPNIPPQCISSSQAQNTGIIHTSGVTVTGTSWCLAQQWDVRAEATDTRTGAAATVHQGVSLYVDAGTTCTVGVPKI